MALQINLTGNVPVEGFLCLVKETPLDQHIDDVAALVLVKDV